MADGRITKRKVTLTNYVATNDVDDNGQPLMRRDQVIDYVPDQPTEGGSPAYLDAYVAAAKAAGWQSVIVGDYDAGPGGYEGHTYVPEGLDHPDAGTTYPGVQEG